MGADREILVVSTGIANSKVWTKMQFAATSQLKPGTPSSNGICWERIEKTPFIMGDGGVVAGKFAPISSLAGSLDNESIAL